MSNRTISWTQIARAGQDIEENGFPELPTFRRAALAPAPVAALAPVWCERTRRWRHPVTRAFVKAPAAH